LIKNDFPAFRLLQRHAGASYAGGPCVECGVAFVHDTRIIIEKERGSYMTDGWKLYHRVCHPTFNEIEIARFVAWLGGQIAALGNSERKPMDNWWSCRLSQEGVPEPRKWNIPDRPPFIVGDHRYCPSHG
jgi:hypothetical protein